MWGAPDANNSVGLLENELQTSTYDTERWWYASNEQHFEGPPWASKKDSKDDQGMPLVQNHSIVGF